MANKQFNSGLVPDGPEEFKCLAKAPKAAQSGDLFINSPIVITAGNATPITVSGGNCTGSVQWLKDSTGKFVNNLASADTGEVGFTYHPNCTYKMLVSTSAYAGTADVGKYYNATAESAVADTATQVGSQYSTMMLDGTSEAESGCTFVAGRKTGLIDNTAGVAYTEVYVRIAADKHTPYVG